VRLVHLVLIGAAVTAMTLASTATQASVNLVADGGFDLSDTLSPFWTVSNFSEIYPRVDHYAPFAHTMTNFVNIGGTGSLNGISQTLSTTPGTTYDFRAWIANLYGPSAVVHVDFGATDLLLTIPVGGYELYSASFIAMSSSTTLGIYSPSKEDDPMHVDAVSVQAATAIPEPMTWAMMLIGFVGLGAFMRRRQAGATIAVA
jgi:hypothetical protein